MNFALNDGSEIAACDFCGMSTKFQRVISCPADKVHICKACATLIASHFEEPPKFLTEEQVKAGPNPHRKTKEAAHG